MTTAFPPHARSGALARGWRGFRRWRRSRPFWGGLFTLLSGAEIFATTQMSLGGLTFQMGPTGFLSWLVPTILAACGLLMWFTPQQRMFYAIVAAMTAVYSLIGVNLGGFFIGLLLGLVGGALGFAWTPTPGAPAPPAEPPPAAGRTDPGGRGAGRRPDEARFDDLLSGPMTDVPPPPRHPLRQQGHPEMQTQPHRPAVPEPGVSYQRPASPYSGNYEPPAQGGAMPRRSPRLFAITLVALSLSATGLVVLRGSEPALAEPCPAPTKPSAPAEPGEPGEPPKPTPTPTPTATPAPEGKEEGDRPVRDFFGGVVDGFKDLFGIDEEEEKPEEPDPSPTASPSAPAGKKSIRKPEAKDPKTEPAQQPPADECDKDGGDKDGKPAKRIAAAPDQPPVGATASRLTGSRVTMFGLSFDGVVELPTASGVVRVLQFSMDRSVTTDFELRVTGANGPTLSLKSTALTVEGNVKFYASRFAGRLLGIPLVFDPDHPPPLTLPIMVFGDPDISLVFVDCDKLTAPSLDIGFR